MYSYQSYTSANFTRPYSGNPIVVNNDSIENVYFCALCEFTTNDEATAAEHVLENEGHIVATAARKK